MRKFEKKPKNGEEETKNFSELFKSIEDYERTLDV